MVLIPRNIRLITGQGDSSAVAPELEEQGIVEMKEARGLIEPVDVLLNVHIVVGLLLCSNKCCLYFSDDFPVN